MIRSTAIRVLPLIPLLLAPATALAQDAAAAVSTLEVGQQVRVQAPGLSVQLGTVSEIDATTLYVLEEGQEWVIEARTIERLEVRRRSVAQNVLIFGAIGALAGLGANKFRESISPPLAGGPLARA